MNKKGFTLVEILGVIVLLGIVFIIAGVGIGKGSENAKTQLYNSKIKNYQKAAVLYAQDNKAYWIKIDSDTELCKKQDDYYHEVTNDCYYYSRDGKDLTYITLNDLVSEEYVKCDEGTKDNECIITNPIDKSNMLDEKNEFTIYKKYGKIYAVRND